jgi:type IV pilus assembly protein PilF
MVLTNAGDCLAQAERGDQARHYWRRALNHEPTFAPALAAMTAHSLARGRLDSANAYFSRYTASAQQSPDLLWLGARIAKADDDAERYAHFVQRLRQAFPLSEQAVQLSE